MLRSGVTISKPNKSKQPSPRVEHEEKHFAGGAGFALSNQLELECIKDSCEVATILCLIPNTPR
ncbi:hypothetical protein AG1IA_06675 [Rhizoctonia solani AG-1 IA]|uniref:Uncharacterized protein n=1 Tax=Thanatephorus cucumeris (strain AG1-IA) TaxID=983506 RepID=L8WSF1_THACA|nr:hypothetical protein AG1IA_06675 [Rhizoctonia solani AG-1 IA]